MERDFQDNTGDAAWRSALRREMTARREAVPAAIYAEWCARLLEHLLAEYSGAPGLVLGFCWPIRQEPDVRAALPHWLAAGCVLALPVVMAPGAPLQFRSWAPGAPLENDCYGIPTPVAGGVVQPDVVLIPLNAFDLQGYRLGYGGGYFDRTLATMSPRPRAIGLGFALNQVASIRPQPHDVPLDAVFTEAGCVFRA